MALDICKEKFLEKKLIHSSLDLKFLTKHNYNYNYNKLRHFMSL